MVKFVTNLSGILFEITQVKESIPWVRCASGNVYWLAVWLYEQKFASFTMLASQHHIKLQIVENGDFDLRRLQSDSTHSYSFLLFRLVEIVHVYTVH